MSRGLYSLTWRAGCDMRHEVEISMEEWGSSVYSTGLAVREHAITLWPYLRRGSPISRMSSPVHDRPRIGINNPQPCGCKPARFLCSQLSARATMEESLLAIQAMPQALLQLIDDSSTPRIAFPVLFTHSCPRVDPLKPNAQIAHRSRLYATVSATMAVFRVCKPLEVLGERICWTCKD
jgi:hypothetical protein